MTFFIGGDEGQWKVMKMACVTGQELEHVSHIEILDIDRFQTPPMRRWRLQGVTSNERYVTRQEKTELLTKSPPLGRTECKCAAMIPIRKNAAWWNLAQDERRQIFEDRSTHISTGIKYLPAIARRLYHCRDLVDPFDFITWFEFTPEDTKMFDELVLKLRNTEEWKYVDREIDIRLERAVNDK